MKNGHLIDRTLGKWTRHFISVVLRMFLTLFYNISCTGRHHLTDLPNGAIVLATHVSKLDGPLILASLYATRRMRPAVHYNEYFHPLQWPVMAVAGAVPLSSPKTWPAEKRAARKVEAFAKLRAILSGKDGFVLLFPGGMAKRQPREIIQPHFSGAYELVKSAPEKPVVIIRLQGLSRFDRPKYDLFWSFIPGLRGRRHVEMTIEVLENRLDTDQDLSAFNADLEHRLNDLPPWPQMAPKAAA